MLKYLQHLGDKNMFPVDSRLRIWQAVREQPLQKKHLDHIAHKLGLPQKDIAELIGVSVRTYQRQDKSTRMTFGASENTIKLAELYETGLNTFDHDGDSFVQWLSTPIPALANAKPIQLLTSPLGIELVKEELLRIEFGIY